MVAIKFSIIVEVFNNNNLNEAIIDFNNMKGNYNNHWEK